MHSTWNVIWRGEYFVLANYLLVFEWWTENGEHVNIK